MEAASALENRGGRGTLTVIHASPLTPAPARAHTTYCRASPTTHTPCASDPLQVGAVSPWLRRLKLYLEPSRPPGSNPLAYTTAGPYRTQPTAQAHRSLAPRVEG